MQSIKTADSQYTWNLKQVGMTSQTCVKISCNEYLLFETTVAPPMAFLTQYWSSDLIQKMKCVCLHFIPETRWIGRAVYDWSSRFSATYFLWCVDTTTMSHEVVWCRDFVRLLVEWNFCQTTDWYSAYLSQSYVFLFLYHKDHLEKQKYPWNWLLFP